MVYIFIKAGFNNFNLISYGRYLVTMWPIHIPSAIADNDNLTIPLCFSDLINVGITQLATINTYNTISAVSIIF
jgi:hypothetical protein